MKLSRLFLAILFFYSLNSTAQEPTEKLSLNDSPIEGQFKYVYQKSSDYEEFKMVKRWHLSRLKTHVLDTLDAVRNELFAVEQIVLIKDEAIDSLIQLNAATNISVEELENEIDSISFFGILLQKAAYNSILWSIISVLVGGLVLFVFLFKRSNIVTVQCKSDLDELRQEFEAYRKRALEREENVARKYHDELIKYKTKTGKPGFTL